MGDSDDDNDDDPPIMMHAIDGDVSRVQQLLEDGIDVNTTDKHSGKTSLHWACEAGELEVVLLLIKYGADLMARGNSEFTPLHVASYHGHPDIVQVLIYAGIGMQNLIKCISNISINARLSPQSTVDGEGTCRKTAFLEACREKVVDVNVKDADGYTPLHLVDQVETAKLLIENGANVHAQNCCGGTPLHEVCEHGFSEVAKFLVENGANVNEENNKGEKPLIYACRGVDLKPGHLEATRFLIENGSDVHSKSTFDGSTALHKTAEGHNYKFSKLLIENGAGIDVRDNDGDTPFHKLCKNFDFRGEGVLLAHFLVENGALINAQNNSGEIPLHHACERGFGLFLEVVQILLGQEAGVDVKDNGGDTPLHKLCKNLKFRDAGLSLTRLLVENGAGINVQNNNGETPLHHACERGFLDVVQLLLSRGGLANIKSKEGCTPLHAACKANEREVVWCLLLYHPWLIVELLEE